MSEINEFIYTINSITDEEFAQNIDYEQASYYYTHGGCYEFAKIIKHFIPKAELMIHKNEDHVAVKIDNEVYDATCERRNTTLNANDFEYPNEQIMERIKDPYLFGIPEIKFDKKRPSDALIEEINSCSGRYINDLIHNINYEKVKKK